MSFEIGIIGTIIVIIYTVKYFRGNRPDTSRSWKERVDCRCKEEVRKVEERMEEFKKERPDIFADE